jgi:hypothetical protein
MIIIYFNIYLKIKSYIVVVKILFTNKKNHKKDPVKMVGSKMTCLKCHLGQVGQGPFGVSFDQFSKSKKPCFLIVHILHLMKPYNN